MILLGFKHVLPLGYHYREKKSRTVLWQRKWLAVASKDRSDTLAKAVTKCDEKRFPNLFVLLKIEYVFPITSAECERSFSAMCRLRT